jgi:catechol 2,3-dioxygenase-like lactoylglutathione lyase family enzyme
MKIDHIAIAQNTEENSDKFFVELLGLRKIRSFLVSADKMMNFFGVNQEYHFLRYEDENLGVEVVITNDNSKSTDLFTHPCLIIENRDELIEKAQKLEFPVIKVPRDSGSGYYLFIKDKYENLYEIK